MTSVLNKITAILILIQLSSCQYFDSQNANKPQVEPEKPIAGQENAARDDLLSGFANSSMGAVAGGYFGQSGSGGIHMVKMEGSLSNNMYNANVYSAQTNAESYSTISENNFHKSLEQPLSTFSIDVDTASYANMRRMLTQNYLPPKDAIRVEELINYFNYDYAQPETGPFAVNLEMAHALWNKKHQLVRIGIKGKEMNTDQRPASNLVFLIDVSGSMDSPERLPLVKSSLTMLVDKLTKNDKISIVVYAGAAGLVLPSTTCDQKMNIIRALDKLKAGGSTNGSGGITLAYKVAEENFIKGGVNRVILATDGDFNVGVTNQEELSKLIKEKAKNNIYLSVLGFGMGNYKDSTMESLSTKGHGNYAYIDTQAEARKVLVEQMTGTLVTIAKDVKIQVEFNPKFVHSYRLIGYENRKLKDEEFNDDKKEAGDIGAGHTVTALYEIIPVSAAEEAMSQSSIDALKYTKTIKPKFDSKKNDQDVTFDNKSKELLTVKLRYKKPDGETSFKLEFPLENKEVVFLKASDSFKFASSVALFGMLLRESEYVKNSSYKQVIEVAQASQGNDTNAFKAEFIELVRKAENLKNNRNEVVDIYEE